MGWLASVAHGDIWAFCLTQPVVEGESISDARQRMVPRWKKYMRRMKALGMTAAMVATHIVWSTRCKGWHYHIHLLMEFPQNGMDDQCIREQWIAFGGDPKVHSDPDACRLVLKAGPAAPALADGSGDLDFWSEKPGEVERAVQYPIRDMAQGISAQRFGDDREKIRECVDEFLVRCNRWRLRQLMGRWKEAPPNAELEAKPKESDGAGADGKASAPAAPPQVAGRITVLFRRARAGDRSAQLIFMALEACCRNDTEFARRFVRYCRLASSPGGP